MDQAQREINDAEWHNPDNWAGIGPFKAYFSKRDSRVFVSRLRSDGWPRPTVINFGHPRGMLYLVVLFIVFLAMTAVVGGNAR
jgi:uncharacterized membrane protein